MALKTNYNNGDPILASSWNETNAAINSLTANGLKPDFEMISQGEWMAMRDAGTLGNTLYFIRNSSGDIARIYYKSTLIARKANTGETVSAGFPVILPIIFS